MITKRYAKANNKFLKDFNPEERSSFITYFDANNLYGKAMSESLPVRNFRWLETKEKWKDFENSILDVDLRIPKDMHEKFKDFPLCPTHERAKLINTLYPKKNFICHRQYLDFVLEQGLVLEKVNRVLVFDSEPWLKSYIEKNTSLRMRAESDFEKDLWKTLNNAVYGKQIEDVRKRVNIKLATTENQLKEIAKSPNF